MTIGMITSLPLPVVPPSADGIGVGCRGRRDVAAGRRRRLAVGSRRAVGAAVATGVGEGDGGGDGERPGAACQLVVVARDRRPLDEGTSRSASGVAGVATIRLLSLGRGHPGRPSRRRPAYDEPAAVALTRWVNVPATSGRAWSRWTCRRRRRVSSAWATAGPGTSGGDQARDGGG